VSQYLISNYIAIVIKAAWYLPKNRHEGQWNRIEDPDTSPHKYSHLIFDRGAQIHVLNK
jgi:hypothetical protein